MEKSTIFRDLIGIIKDKVSLSKAALLSTPIRLAVLRATTHYPPAPPDDRRISLLLLLGKTPHATATIIPAVTDRLRRTGNCVVALKCLLVVHHVIKSGIYVLDDYPSSFHSGGGRNYLKLSAFHEGATAATWSLSAWVRWFARYLETLLSTSRVLGYFVCSSSCAAAKETHDRWISSFSNVDLIRDVDSLVVVIEEICKAPDYNIIEECEMLVKEIMGLLLPHDYIALINEILIRLNELNGRLSCLNFNDSVELVCALKRLQDCRERLSVLFAVNKASVEIMWCLVEDLKMKVGILNVYRGGGKLLSLGRRGKVSDSVRSGERVSWKGDSVKYQ
ncbi:hypothetical protein OROGR_019082 [Orobanche gracilis]